MTKATLNLLKDFQPSVDLEELNTLTHLETDFKVLRLDQLHSHPGNRDVDDMAVEELAESIRTDGLGQPILVRRDGDEYEVIAGHHRVAAKRLLAEKYPDETEHKVIEAAVRDMGDAEAESLMLATNLYVNELSREERAAMMKQLAREIPQLREEEPERYKGVATAQIVADMVTEQGAPVSRATVERDLKVSRDAEKLDAVREKLDENWVAVEKELPAAMLIDIAGQKEAVQKNLYENYTYQKGRENKTAAKKSLSRELALTDANPAETLMFKTFDVLNAALDDLQAVQDRGFYIDSTLWSDFLKKVNTIDEKENKDE